MCCIQDDFVRRFDSVKSILLPPMEYVTPSGVSYSAWGKLLRVGYVTPCGVSYSVRGMQDTARFRWFKSMKLYE